MTPDDALQAVELHPEALTFTKPPLPEKRCCCEDTNCDCTQSWINVLDEFDWFLNQTAETALSVLESNKVLANKCSDLEMQLASGRKDFEDLTLSSAQRTEDFSEQLHALEHQVMKLKMKNVASARIIEALESSAASKTSTSKELENTTKDLRRQLRETSCQLSNTVDQHTTLQDETRVLRERLHTMETQLRDSEGNCTIPHVCGHWEGVSQSDFRSSDLILDGPPSPEIQERVALLNENCMLCEMLRVKETQLRGFEDHRSTSRATPDIKYERINPTFLRVVLQLTFPVNETTAPPLNGISRKGEFTFLPYHWIYLSHPVIFEGTVDTAVRHLSDGD